jgi:catechol 2,3-dioxygenase-like lactoylglutathione lyase family enzyme
MSESISCLHMNHINAVVEGVDDLSHFRDLYGAQYLLGLPEFQSCLFIIGTVIFELFVPQDYLLNARFGPHYVGVEYQVPDTAEARQAAQARGIRLLGDIGVAFHTHPADTFGVAVEIYHRNFHTEGIPNGYLEPIRPAGYWSDEHPLGITGLKRYSIVVSDVDAATKFFKDFMNATVLYEASRPEVGARAVGLALGDTVAELLTPTEDREIQHYLARYGDGIRSTVFAVRDLQQAKSHFTERGITLKPGDTTETLAIAPEDNCGLLFEFSE